MHAAIKTIQKEDDSRLDQNKTGYFESRSEKIY